MWMLAECRCEGWREAECRCEGWGEAECRGEGWREVECRCEGDWKPTALWEWVPWQGAGLQGRRKLQVATPTRPGLYDCADTEGGKIYTA